MDLRRAHATLRADMNPRLVYGAALLLLALAGIGAQSYYWPQIADDSFIFFRYAENLAAGDGLDSEPEPRLGRLALGPAPVPAPQQPRRFLDIVRGRHVQRGLLVEQLIDRFDP